MYIKFHKKIVLNCIYIYKNVYISGRIYLQITVYYECKKSEINDNISPSAIFSMYAF